MTNPDLVKELTENLDEAEWEWLIPHVQRNALIVVHNQLSLVEVGCAIATDNTTEVQRWIHEALIAKPSVQQLGEWNTNKQKRFQSLIVQPYVLVKEKAI
jgi:hypothetical protein